MKKTTDNSTITYIFFRFNVSPVMSLINNENKWPKIKNKLEAKNQNHNTEKDSNIKINEKVDKFTSNGK